MNNENNKSNTTTSFKLIFISLITVTFQLLISKQLFAQSIPNDRRAYFLLQLESEINPAFIATSNKSELESVLSRFELWKSLVEDENLSVQLYEETRNTQLNIFNSIGRISRDIKIDCSLGNRSLAKANQIFELVRWGKWLQDIIEIGMQSRVQEFIERATECAKLKLNVKSKIVAASPTAPITALIDSDLYIDSVISYDNDANGELLFSGSGAIDFIDITIPPFSKKCTTDYLTIPSVMKVHSVNSSTDSLQNLRNLSIIFEPGQPVANIMVTCNGMSIPMPFDVWGAIWKDLHISERTGHFFNLTNWSGASDNDVIKYYENSKGDLSENTTIKLMYRE